MGRCLHAAAELDFICQKPNSSNQSSGWVTNTLREPMEEANLAFFSCTCRLHEDEMLRIELSRIVTGYFSLTLPTTPADSTGKDRFDRTQGGNNAQ